MSNGNKKLLSKKELLSYIKDDYIPDLDSLSGKVLIMAGAGDIDAMVAPVKDIIEQTNSGL
jgi:UDP-N-acetylmuramate--alanine ligase